MIIDSPIISGSYAASGSLNQFGNVTITGSLTVTGNIIGTASAATSASYALTASHATNVPQTSSFADNATSASYAATASYISGSGGGVGFPFSGSAVITGSLLITELSGSGTKYVITDNNGLLSISSGSTAIKVTETITSTTNQTSFTVPNGYTTGLVDVFINGIKLSNAEFTDNDGVTITLATGSNSGDVVEFAKYQPANGVTNNALRQQTTFIADAGQTVFSASYTPGLLDIFYNGSRLSNSDYTANNGTYFTLATASAVNDILDVFVYSYQVGAFNGIGGAGVPTQIAYFNTTSSITGSNNFTINGSTMTVTGSLLVSGSGTFTNIGPAVLSGSVNISGSLAVGGADVVLSTQTSSLNVATASFAATASSADNLLVRNTLTAQTLVVQTITSSVDFVTGSTQFGSLLSNTHVFSGSVTMNPGGLFVSSSGRVGIGTINPDLSLSINGAMNLRNSTRAGAFEIDSSGNLWMGTATTAGNIYLETGHSTTGLPSTGTARLTISSTGATFSSSIAATSATFSGNITANSNTGGVYLNRAATTDYSGIIFSTNNVLRWFSGMREVGTGNDYIIYNTPNNINVLRLNESTGAATFASSLTTGGRVIANTMVFKNSDGSADMGFLGNRSGWTGGAADNNMAIGSYQPNICFFTNNSTTEVMRITSGGYVGIGTGTSNPGAILEASQGADTRILVTSTSNQTSGVYLRSLSSGTLVGNATLRVNNAGSFQVYTGTSSDALQMTLTSGGNLQIPNQPSWNVGLSTQQSFSTGVPNTINWNQSSGNDCFIQGGVSLNGSNGRITVPVAGKYVILVSIRTESTGAATGTNLNFRKNGGTILRYYVGTSVTSAGSFMYLETRPVVVNCSANDYLDFYFDSVNNDFALSPVTNTVVRFSGYLVG